MKRGVTVSTLAIAVVIMLIVLSITAVAGSNSITNARYEENISKIRRVSDAVRAYIASEKELPITGNALGTSGLNDELRNIILRSEGAPNLFIVDMSLLPIESNIGNEELGLDDIFVVSEITHNVYYVRGIEYKSEKIYTHFPVIP